MTRSHSVLDRLRTSRLLRAWIVVLAVAGFVSALHVASHIGGAFASVGGSSSVPTGGGDGHHDDCPLFRLAGSCALPRLPAAWLALLIACLCGVASLAPTSQHGPVDAALRWFQQRKHGPPAFSR